MKNFIAIEKGRVGGFSVWLVGPQNWQIRSVRIGEILATAPNMNLAYKIAEQLNGGIFRQGDKRNKFSREAGVKFS